MRSLLFRIRSNLSLGINLANSYYFLMNLDISYLQSEMWLTEEHLLKIMRGWQVFVRLIQGGEEEALFENAPEWCDRCRPGLSELEATVTQRILGDYPLEMLLEEASKLKSPTNEKCRCRDELRQYLDLVRSNVGVKLNAALKDKDKSADDESKRKCEEENIREESDDEVDNEGNESEGEEENHFEEEIEAWEWEDIVLSPVSID